MIRATKRLLITSSSSEWLSTSPGKSRWPLDGRQGSKVPASRKIRTSAKLGLSVATIMPIYGEQQIVWQEPGRGEVMIPAPPRTDEASARFSQLFVAFS
ncbi:MAG: hypothetical protein WD627_06585, partial [Actinomycetota bacterium]